MCASLGCNAVGVMGCRIIDSPRERLIALLTANFTPCNGRLPALVTVLAMLPMLAGRADGTAIYAALGMTAALALSVLLTLTASRLLSATLLRGRPSSFTLELPPYRRPAVGRVLVRSLADRTLRVLGRAAAVAAPAGAVIWCMANIRAGGVTLLVRSAAFLDPIGRLMGLDGTILLAFILGFPANEIVLPLTVMGYLAGSAPGPVTEGMAALFAAHGWNVRTAVCLVLFELAHWPCGTTCAVLRQEFSRSEGRRRAYGWTALAILLPTVLGFLLCTVVSQIWQVFAI